MPLTSRSVALFILICLIEISEEKCANFTRDTTCDTLDDLYNTSSILHKKVTISSDAKNVRQLVVVPSERVQNIETLRIVKAINGIDEDAFKNFPKLQDLFIYSNNLSEISTGIFRKLNLKHLSLDSCGIKTISIGAFVSLPQLQTLRLTNNNLTEIQKNIFHYLPVTTLALSKNQITKIEKFAFANMSNLNKLYLDNNQLTTFVAQEHVDHADRLERLWLHGNKMTEVTIYMLQGLRNLKVLNLGFNSISNIEPKAFAETPNLTTLVLTHNDLTVLDGNVLPSTGLLQLNILYLDHNRLTFLSSNFLLRLNSLKAMSIGGNPWQCPCLDLIFRWLYDLNVKLKCEKGYLNGERPICVVPDKQPKTCTYSYDEQHYKTFQEQARMYPPPPFCIL